MIPEYLLREPQTLNPLTAAQGLRAAVGGLERVTAFRFRVEGFSQPIGKSTSAMRHGKVYRLRSKVRMGSRMMERASRRTLPEPLLEGCSGTWQCACQGSRCCVGSAYHDFLPCWLDHALTASPQDGLLGEHHAGTEPWYRTRALDPLLAVCRTVCQPAA